jgi:hypothetical protein
MHLLFHYWSGVLSFRKDYIMGRIGLRLFFYQELWGKTPTVFYSPLLLTPNYIQTVQQRKKDKLQQVIDPCCKLLRMLGLHPMYMHVNLMKKISAPRAKGGSDVFKNRSIPLFPIVPTSQNHHFREERLMKILPW